MLSDQFGNSEGADCLPTKERHSFDALLGMSWQESNAFGINVSVQNFPSDYFGFNNIGAGSNNPVYGSGASRFSFNSYFRRVNPGTGVDDLNIHQIRFAEVLLAFAEATNEVGGPTAPAYDALKRVTDRAQLELPVQSSFSKESFRLAVWKERWHELCYEGITWFDMVRLRKVLNDRTGAFDDFIGHINLSSNQPLKEQHLLLPLPTLEM